MNPIVQNIRRNAAALSALLTQFSGERPEMVVLELDGDYPLKPAMLSLTNLQLGGRPETLLGLYRKLEQLADSQIPGVVLVVRNFEGGLAKAFAVRQMLSRFRASGKRLVVYAETLDNVTLYIASVADRLIMLAEGEMHAKGLAARNMPLRGLLEKIGLEPEFEQRYEYKSGAEMFTSYELSPANREQITALLSSVFEHWLETIAASRGLQTERLREFINGAPLSASEAQAQVGGLLEIAYEDEVTLEAQPWSMAARFAPPRFGWNGPDGVAVVTLEGALVPGESHTVPLPLPIFGGAQAGSTTMVRALRSAAQNKHVLAVVLYVDSPGGSALASEIVWREVVRTVKHKPVVAVMGETAASGGYYVLAGATRVLAAPATVTGSIGILGGTINAERLWERLGLRPQTVKLSEHADYPSLDRRLTESERVKLNEQMDHIYATFKSRVAAGRKMSVEAVEHLARGRIWSGLQARELGLVDDLGTLFDAVELARELAGLPSTAPAWVVNTPGRFVAPTDLTPLVRHAQRLAGTRIWAMLPQGLEIR